MAEETVAEIEQAGGNAIAFAGDMAVPAGMDNLVAKTTEAFGNSIDILINNVGGLVGRRTIAEMEQDFFEHVMKLNMTSEFLVTKAVMPHMSSGSSVVNVCLSGSPRWWRSGHLGLRGLQGRTGILYAIPGQGARPIQYTR